MRKNKEKRRRRKEKMSCADTGHILVEELDHINGPGVLLIKCLLCGSVLASMPTQWSALVSPVVIEDRICAKFNGVGGQFGEARR